MNETKYVMCGKGSDPSIRENCIEKGYFYIETDKLKPNMVKVLNDIDLKTEHKDYDNSVKYIICGKGSKSDIKENCREKGFVYVETKQLKPDMVLVMTAEEAENSIYLEY